jgi:membrane associated rhomboid family serine protease
MFPLRDDNPTEITPIFTMGLILACLATWVLLQGGGFDPGVLRGSVCRWGVIPGELTGAMPSASLPGGMVCEEGGGPVTVLTSMFLHGSWPHLIGNLWFLWIFGNNIEDSMGHLRFLLFYLLTGVAAVGAQAWADPGSPLPMVGASGAISGIMGAYLVLYPRARISTLFLIIILVQVVWVPAWVMLGYWFLIQFMAGASQPPGQGGVAFWAHVGGFVAGVLLVKPFENRTLSNAKRARVHLSRGEIPGGGWW